MSKIVFAFMRCNPPTNGHARVIEQIHKTAYDRLADHLVVLSRSYDAKNNPLDPDKKLKYMEHFWPHVNFELSRPELPTLMHYVKDLSKEYDELIFVCGADRKEEYENLMKKYNGKEFFFRKITTLIVGNEETRDEISATQMRKWAKDGEFVPFFFGSPKRSADDTTEVIKLYNDVRKGLKAA